MASLNKAMIIGRLGVDPEVRYTPNDTAVVTMSVATTERYKDSNGELIEKTEWHRIVAWGRLAEICNEYLKKGSLVYFEGPIQTRSWENKDGEKQYTTEIKALGMQMLDTRGAPSSEEPAEKKESKKQDKKSSKPSKKSVQGVEEEDTEDDLPF